MSGGISSPGIVLKFQSNYRTFSPEQFVAAFGGKGFVETQVTAHVSINPRTPPVPTVMYSKGDLLVFLNDAENLVQFHVLNAVEAGGHMSEIRNILGSLNFEPSSTANMTAALTATVKSGTSPIGGLTSLVDSDTIERITKMHGPDSKIAVTSIRFSLVESRDESLSVVMEPFGNDPDGAYYVDVQYSTTIAEKFNIFLEKIGTEMLHGIIKGVEESD